MLEQKRINFWNLWNLSLKYNLSLLFFFFLFVIPVHTQEKPDWSKPGKYLICNVSKEYKDFWREEINWPIINKNWDAIAAKTLKGTKWSVLLNNKPGTFYSEVKHLQFTPNGDTLVYVGMKGVNKLFRRALSVRINEESDERLYDEISPTIFTPDGKNWAYKIRDDDDWYLVVNGIESKRYDSVNYHKFSPDGTSLIFIAKLDGKSFLVTDGEEGKRYDDIFAITFNPMNSEASYWAVSNGNYYLVSGSKEINISRQVPPVDNSILFNPKGNSFAYFVRDILTDDYYVVQDGIYSNPYDRIKWEEALYSNDGTTLAYPAGKGNIEFVVLNGKEEENFDAVRQPKFSNDNFSIIYIANQGNKWFAVINRKKEKRYDMVKEALFSPSGNSYAYFAKEGNKWMLVRNGVESANKYDDVSDLSFTPDGSKIVYIATEITKTVSDKTQKETRRQKLIIDSDSSKEYEKILKYKVTDNNRVSFLVKEKDSYFIVTDGKEGESFSAIPDFEVSPDGTRIGYFGAASNRIYWVVD